MQGKQSKENVVVQESGTDPGENNLPPPVPIPIESLVALIQSQNPTLSMEQARQVVKKLGWQVLELC